MAYVLALLFISALEKSRIAQSFSRVNFKISIAFAFHMREETLKERITQVLMENWPLKPKKLYQLLSKKAGKKTTYYNMHFQLRELFNNGVVSQVGTAYHLNPLWVAENLQKFEGIFSSYVQYGLLKPKEPFQELTFHSIWEAFCFVLKQLNHEIATAKAEAVYVQLARLFPIPLPENYAEMLRSLAKTKRIIILCRLKRIPDRLSANYLRSLGIEVHLGVPSAIIANSILFNGCIMNFHVAYQKDVLDSFNRFYFALGLKSILQQDVFTRFLDFVKKPLKVYVTLIQNQEAYADSVMQTMKLIPSR